MSGEVSRINGRLGGRKPGPDAFDKAFHRQRLRDIVTAELEPLVKAQVAHAQGVQYMVLRHPDGTFTRATDVKQVDAACAIGASAFQIFTQSPNTAAFTDLMNRVLDKPAEPKLEVELTGSVELVATRLIEARRQRLLSAKPEPAAADDESSE